MARNEYFLGVDIGGTKNAISLAQQRDCSDCASDRAEDISSVRREDGSELVILGKRRIATVGKPYDILETLAALGSELISEQGLATSDISGVGISCGGPLDPENGIILSPPNLPGWDRIEAARFFRERFGAPAKLCNDADACALAEWKFGAGRGVSSMIFLTFGTGLGAGIIINGRLWQGAHGLAGEIGHVRLTPSGPTGYGKSGSCEGYCSGGGIAQLAAARGLPTDARRVAELAYEGDPRAVAVYRESGEMLGRTCAILSDLLDPERIVIGSIFARSRELLEPYMLQTLSREALRVCEIVPAALGERVGDFAALSAIC